MIVILNHEEFATFEWMWSSDTMYLVHVHDLIADEEPAGWQNRREEFFLFIYFIVFSGCDSPLGVFYNINQFIF